MQAVEKAAGGATIGRSVQCGPWCAEGMARAMTHTVGGTARTRRATGRGANGGGGPRSRHWAWRGFSRKGPRLRWARSAWSGVDRRWEDRDAGRCTRCGRDRNRVPARRGPWRAGRMTRNLVHTAGGTAITPGESTWYGPGQTTGGATIRPLGVVRAVVQEVEGAAIAPPRLACRALGANGGRGHDCDGERRAGRAGKQLKMS
jgi:hypothetical protein